MYSVIDMLLFVFVFVIMCLCVTEFAQKIKYRECGSRKGMRCFRCLCHVFNIFLSSFLQIYKQFLHVDNNGFVNIYETA